MSWVIERLESISPDIEELDQKYRPYEEALYLENLSSAEPTSSPRVSVDERKIK